MSITAINWARQQKTGAPLRQLVLFVLADYTDQWGFCWPTQPTLASICQVDERSIRRAIKELEDQNLIDKVIVRMGRSQRAMYRMRCEWVKDPIPDEHPAAKIVTRTKSPPEKSHPDSAAVHPDSDGSFTRTQESGNPLLNPPVNPNAPARACDGSPAPALADGSGASLAIVHRAAVAKKSFGRYRYSDWELQECIDAGELSVEEAIKAGGNPDRLKRIEEQGAGT